MKKISPDKVLFAILFLTLSVVVMSQIGLVFPETRGVFTNVENYEGVKIDKNEIPSAHLTLEMISGSPSENIQIMVNGEKKDVFDKKEKTIEITHTSVVEIYALDIENSATVRIKSFTDNLKNTTALEEISVDNGFNMVGRFLYSN